MNNPQTLEKADEQQVIIVGGVLCPLPSLH